jgi:Alternative oxidase
VAQAENERMHLLTFMQLKQPGWFFRTVVLGTQGIFCNLFFFAYLISPSYCHRCGSPPAMMALNLPPAAFSPSVCVIHR